MSTDCSELTPQVVEAVAEALAGVPRAAYSVPHVYPAAAPAYAPAPRAVRPQPPVDRFSLYVHLPYCRYRCSFCHFVVRVGADATAMQRYVRAVARELEWIPAGARLSQLYVGGGTPTALPPDLMDEVLSAVFARTERAGEGVHTVETSPETISEGHLEVFRRHGIGRVSMGVQSLERKVLDTIARRHEFERDFDDQLSGRQLGVGLSARSHLGRAIYRNHEVHDTYIARIERDESPVQERFDFEEDDSMTQFIARSLGDGRS